MAELQPQKKTSIAVGKDQPLIGIPLRENGGELVRHFADEREADETVGADGVEPALSLAGARADMDWNEALDELDRTRHESQPAPPVDLNV